MTAPRTDLAAAAELRDWQDCVFDVMHDADHHIYQVLTKRPDEVVVYLKNFRPLPHVWIGCSAEDQPRADERREAMEALARMGWLTWVSYEPALAAVNWKGWEFLKWMVSGGESGKHARPAQPDWHRATRDFAAQNNIAYLFKQWGEFAPVYAPCAPEPAEQTYHVLHRPDGVPNMQRVGKKAAGRLLDGREWNQFPESLT